MREILFRGRLLDTNHYHYAGWVYGSLVYSPSEDHYYIIEHSDDELSYPVDKETIGQFTGLCDKNGTKIFEGDIVECQTRKGKGVAPIVFEKGKFCAKWFEENWKQYFYYEINSKFKVIGNIYDNPELLGDDND